MPKITICLRHMYDENTFSLMLFYKDVRIKSFSALYLFSVIYLNMQYIIFLHVGLVN